MYIYSHLKYKNILFISVATFGLEIQIKKKLESFGATVTYFNERPSNSNLVKAIIRVRRDFLGFLIKSYYKKILSQINDVRFDYFFVNKGEVIPEFFILKFKKINPGCVMIYYTWDSFMNNPNPINLLKHFDRKFTFDPVDALSYNLNFRPLFYPDNYANKSRTKFCENFKHDLVFLGTVHSDRIKIGNEIADWCVRNNNNYFFNYYMPSRFLYLYKKIFEKSFFLYGSSMVSFTSLSSAQIQELYSSSNVILDINHPAQSGLTMRTFESIGLRKKLITTNINIKMYEFYNPQNILVIDRSKISISDSFFNSPYQDVNHNTYCNSSLASWLNCLFFETESNFWIAGV